MFGISQVGKIDFYNLGTGRKRGAIQLHLAGYLDEALDPGSAIPVEYKIRKYVDIALLSTDSHKIPRNADAGLPAAAVGPSFQAILIGINGLTTLARKPTPALLSMYPPGVKEKELLEAAKKLKPHRISVAAGRAEFSNVVSKNDNFTHLVHEQDSTADLITYHISTAAGASGSPISAPGVNYIYGK